jgi:hypothetical protein
MREFVGVTSFLPTDARVMFLKRDALIFNRLAIPTYDGLLETLRKETDENFRFFASELEWLFDKGVIFEPEVTVPEISEVRYGDEFYGYASVVTSQSIEMLRHLLQNEPEQFPTLASKDRDDFLKTINDSDLSEILDLALGCDSRKIVKRIDPRNPSHIEASIRIIYEYLARGISVQLRELANMDAYPIVTSHIHAAQRTQADKSDVVQIIINALPIPDDSVPWEQIFDYRSDPDSVSKFLALRNWMNDIARAKLRPAEIEEKLEYLIDQYKRHLTLHKLKTNVGALETLVVAGPEFLANLIKLKWGEIAKGLFSFRHRRIAIIEGELTAPGNEIAYIVNAGEKFS